MGLPLHFLIADESKGVRTFLQQLLQGYGFDPKGIRLVSTSDMALKAAEDFIPDFLVTDWFAEASLTGIDLFKKIRQKSPHCHLALMSKEITPEHQAIAKELGAHFLLIKPFTAQQLKDEINKSLKLLAVSRPDLMARLRQIAGPEAQERKRLIQPGPVPKIQQLKHGDQVIYGNKAETVDYVILRNGELIVHLQSKSGFVPASELRKA